jgi:catechol 2,3-dioxygenase-like lactoylglutathione lyase family enzyme
MIDRSGVRPRLAVSMVTLTSPQPRTLADFYRRLLGYDLATQEPEWVVLRPPVDGVALAFQLEGDYQPPVWPATDNGAQQMMMHLEIRVDDLAAAVDHAVECGATVAAFQPQELVRVCLDPDGHPFCLWVPEDGE